MFSFPQNYDLPRFLFFRAAGGMRQVQISCDICTRFARYLYSTKQCWIIKDLIRLGGLFFHFRPPDILYRSVMLSKGIITWSEMGQQIGQANKVYFYLR